MANLELESKSTVQFLHKYNLLGKMLNKLAVD